MYKTTAAGLVLASIYLASPSFADDAKPAAALQTADASKPASEPAVMKDYVVIQVNGDKIMKSDVELVWKSVFPQGQAPEFDSFDERIRQNVLRGLLSERLVYKEALKNDVDKRPDVAKRLEALKRQLVMQAFLEDKIKDDVTDAKLKDAYDAKAKEESNKEEVHARHILVKSEDEAKSLIKQIKGGADFSKLAKEKSDDKASGAAGGDLGYFTEDKMVPEFAKAAFAMKKGDISDTPVKTEFGWHVIKIEDRRKMAMPGFAEMKDKLKQEVAEKAIQNYVNSMVTKADIKYYDASGKEKDFPKAPPMAAAPADAAPAAGEAK